MNFGCRRESVGKIASRPAPGPATVKYTFATLRSRDDIDGRDDRTVQPRVAHVDTYHIAQDPLDLILDPPAAVKITRH